MYTRILVFQTKLLIKVLRMFGKNASALPGLIVETFSPNFLERVLKPVEKKIVIITGTNGKTTTTKMVVHALRGGNERVVTNSTGSNMTRGLISALLDDMTLTGSLRETDWFVFEMDEAYAPQFTKNLSVYAVLALNVLRDQLDRYGEIDKTAQLIGEAGKKSDHFVYNIHDPLLKKIAEKLNKENKEITSFGVVENITEKIKNEQNMFTKSKNTHINADFMLTKLSENSSSQQIEVLAEQKNMQASMMFRGVHNALNATAACALLARLEPSDYDKLFVDISTMHPPFGRGEELVLNNKKIIVALVKNPSGFTHNLETFIQQGEPEEILFVVNDRFADGRDVSWLWDVNFKGILPEGAKILCSGIRGYDMALRLKHDGYKSDVELEVERAVEKVMDGNSKNVVIIPTYTALYEARAALASYGKVPRIW